MPAPKSVRGHNPRERVLRRGRTSIRLVKDISRDRNAKRATTTRPRPHGHSSATLQPSHRKSVVGLDQAFHILL